MWCVRCSSSLADWHLRRSSTLTKTVGSIHCQWMIRLCHHGRTVLARLWETLQWTMYQMAHRCLVDTGRLLWHSSLTLQKEFTIQLCRLRDSSSTVLRSRAPPTVQRLYVVRAFRRLQTTETVRRSRNRPSTDRSTPLTASRLIAWTSRALMVAACCRTPGRRCRWMSCWTAAGTKRRLATPRTTATGSRTSVAITRRSSTSSTCLLTRGQRTAALFSRSRPDWTLDLVQMTNGTRMSLLSVWCNRRWCSAALPSQICRLHPHRRRKRTLMTATTATRRRPCHRRQPPTMSLLPCSQLLSVANVAQWLGRQSLTGRLSLTCAQSSDRSPLCW